MMVACTCRLGNSKPTTAISICPMHSMTINPTVITCKHGLDTLCSACFTELKHSLAIERKATELACNWASKQPLSMPADPVNLPNIFRELAEKELKTGETP